MRARALGQFWVPLLLAFPVLPAVAAPCDALLADGVVDRAHVNNTLDLAKRVSGWFCGKRFASYQEATSATLEARLPVDELLIPFGLHKDRKNFAQAYRSFCQSATPSELLTQAGSLRPFIAANKSLVEGYLACTQRGGLQLYAEVSEDPRAFSLVMKSVPTSSAGAVQIRDIVAAQSDGKNIECRPTLPGSGAQVSDVEQRYLCSRDPKRATSLTVTTSEGARAISLAAHAHYHIFRDEVAGDSNPAVAQAASANGDSAPVCVGGQDGNVALGNYVIDYHQTAGVRVDSAEGRTDRPKGSWSFSVKEPTRVCLVAHAAAEDASPVAYKIHYVFYRYRVEKDHHF